MVLLSKFVIKLQEIPKVPTIRKAIPRALGICETNVRKQRNSIGRDVRVKLSIKVPRRERRNCGESR